MARKFDREALLGALDTIGHAAIDAKTRLTIVVYGGSALLLASNFRFSTEDVDIAPIDHPWPVWLSTAVRQVAARNQWLETWLNEAVSVFLSPNADPKRDLALFGTFPRATEETGLAVFVPSARYMRALKLKAFRVADFERGSADIADIANLLAVLGIQDIEAAIGVLAEFFPKSAADADKQRFVLKYILSSRGSADAPHYPRTGV